MNRKLIKRVVLGTLGVLVVLVITLGVHIYMVTGTRANDDKRMRQLGRIDFKQDIDSVEAAKIRGHVSRMEGINAVYFNVKDDIFVYTFTVGTQTTDKVFKEVMSLNSYKAEKFVLDPKALANGCPIMDKNSLMYRLSVYFERLFS